MKEHQFILVLFLVLATMVAALFYYIFRSSLRPESDKEGMENPLKNGFSLL